MSVATRNLSLMERAQKEFLKFFLALPDRYYRLQFKSFDDWQQTQNKRYIDISEKTRVTSFIGTLGPGGAERQLTLTLTGFAASSRLDMQLYCQSLAVEWQRFFLQEIEVAGIRVADLTPLTQTAEAGDISTVLPCDLKDSVRFTVALKRECPHVAHFWLDECNIKGGLAALAEGIPKIVLGLRSLPPCNFALHQPYMREGYRYLARQPNVILVNNSHAGARAYEEWLGLEQGKIHVIHNGFCFDESELAAFKADRNRIRSEFGIKPTDPVVGLVGRLSEEKRPILWLEIAARIKRELPEAKFLIAGDGVQMRIVQERAAQTDLAGSVVLLGHRRDPLAIIAAMDVFLLTSRLEGLPNVLVEAQALGIPVIAPAVGGAPETFEDGVSGRLFEIAEPGHVARQVVEVLRDPDWRALVASRGPFFVREHFAVERMLRETRALYELNLAGIT